MWSYAELSQMASAVGGPENLVKSITEHGIKIGIKRAKNKYELIGVLIGAGLTGVSVGAGLLVYDAFFKDKKTAISEADNAEQLLIDGIKAYDAEIKGDPKTNPLPKISREEAEGKIKQFVLDVAKEQPRKSCDE